MNTIFKMLLAGLLVFVVVGCGEEPQDGDTSGGDGDADGDSDIDTAADTTPVTPIDKLVGMSYLVQFDKDFWNEPSLAIGSEMGANVPGFLFQFSSVTEIDAQNATFTAILGTAGDDGSQNMCNKTIEVTGTLTSTDSTVFAFDPIDISAIISGRPDDNNLPMQLVAPIYSFAIGGTFVNQGEGFRKGTMDAYMDFRDVYCLFTLLTNPTPDSICGLMASDYYYECEACAYSGAPAGSYCITLGANLYKIESPAGLDVVPVADFDMSCVNDESCVM